MKRQRYSFLSSTKYRYLAWHQATILQDDHFRVEIRTLRDSAKLISWCMFHTRYLCSSAHSVAVTSRLPCQKLQITFLRTIWNADMRTHAKLSAPRVPFTDVCRFCSPWKAVKRKRKASEMIHRFAWNIDQYARNFCIGFLNKTYLFIFCTLKHRSLQIRSDLISWSPQSHLNLPQHFLRPPPLRSRQRRSPLLANALGDELLTGMRIRSIWTYQ